MESKFTPCPNGAMLAVLLTQLLNHETRQVRAKLTTHGLGRRIPFAASALAAELTMKFARSALLAR